MAPAQAGRGARPEVIDAVTAAVQVGGMAHCGSRLCATSNSSAPEKQKALIAQGFMRGLVGRGPSNKSHKPQILNNIPRAPRSQCPQECPQAANRDGCRPRISSQQQVSSSQESWRRGRTPALNAVLVLRDRLMFPHAHHERPWDNSEPRGNQFGLTRDEHFFHGRIHRFARSGTSHRSLNAFRRCRKRRNPHATAREIVPKVTDSCFSAARRPRAFRRRSSAFVASSRFRFGAKSAPSCGMIPVRSATTTKESP